MEWNKEWNKEENKDKDNWSLRMQKKNANHIVPFIQKRKCHQEEKRGQEEKRKK